MICEKVVVVVGGGGVSYISFAGLSVLCPHIPSDVLFQGVNVNDASEVSPKSVLKVKVFTLESSKKKGEKNYQKKKTIVAQSFRFCQTARVVG